MRMFSPLDGVGEDAATGSAAGPLACHLARHGLVPWGEEIEIEQGAEIGRPSTLYARATGSGDGIESVEVGGSAVTVARGEFKVPVVTQRDGFDVGQLGRERAPEAAAVGGEVEPVPGGVEHPVRVGRVDRDVEARRQPAARLAPGRAAVARDQQRRPAVDERDDGRAARPTRRRAAAARARARSRSTGASTSPRTSSFSTSTSNTPSTVRTRAITTASSSTRAAVVAAWRAADAGRWPAARAQT